VPTARRRTLHLAEAFQPAKTDDLARVTGCNLFDPAQVTCGEMQTVCEKSNDAANGVGAVKGNAAEARDDARCDLRRGHGRWYCTCRGCRYRLFLGQAHYLRVRQEHNKAPNREYYMHAIEFALHGALYAIYMKIWKALCFSGPLQPPAGPK